VEWSTTSTTCHWVVQTNGLTTGALYGSAAVTAAAGLASPTTPSPTASARCPLRKWTC